MLSKLKTSFIVVITALCVVLTLKDKESRIVIKKQNETIDGLMRVISNLEKHSHMSHDHQ